MAKPSQINKRLRKLVLFSTFSAVILVASTYAWFIGMQTVNIAPFDVEIAAIDGLTLSLDGRTFHENVAINSTNFDDDVNTVYTGHTNSWGNGGLRPVSSIGQIDAESSRLMLFEKSSLTSTTGGYRLMASRIPNDKDATGEYKGYVAFDLFVRNLSGTEYFDGPANILNEEAIYLTNDSEVKVSNNGGVKDSGIENSVRVAFAQIGRVEAFRDGNALDPTDDADAITLIRGIKCTTPADGVTALCINRPATIWEPNDTKHVANAINHYNKSCRIRTGSDVFATGAYTTADNCMPLVNGLYSSTYSIAAKIDVADAVDIYDGASYNKYAGSLITRDSETNDITGGYLEYPSDNIITDTAKFQEGTNRPEFIRLAPNSITKIRVYIYLEGQDVDNYDFSAVGQKISVAFGLTKQRYTEADTEYSGPALNEGDGPAGADKTVPVIKFGSLTSTYTLAEAQALTETELYFPIAEDGTTKLITATDLKVTAVDPYAATTDDLTTAISYEGIVNVNVPGTYTVVYKVRDLAGNLGTKVRQVTITDPDAVEDGEGG